MRWSVTVTAAGPQHDQAIDSDDVGDLVAALHKLSASGGGEGHRYDVTVSVEADDARRAADAAMEAVRRAADHTGLPQWPVVRLEAEAELDAELAQPALPELAGVAEAAAILHVTAARVRAFAAQGWLPPPLVQLGDTPVWDAHALRAAAERHPTT